MASTTHRPQYPRAFALMLTDEQADRIESEAETAGLSKAVVLRTYLEAGFAAVDEGSED